jgi:hypothetical protein
MKKNHTTISRILTASLMLFMVSVLTLLGQTPTTFNYQAVLRDADGYINADANVNIELEIHQGTASGAVAYSEVHSVTTSEFGLVNLEIGSVTPASFATIDWAAGPYFVEVSVDGISMGVSELLTVPYALYAVNGVPGPQGDQGIQGEIGPEGPPGVIEANSVGSSHVIDNSLTVDDLGAGSVGSSEVADNSLTANDLATNSVGAAEIATGAVGAAEIADGSVGALEIATGAVGSIEIATGTILDVDINASAAIASSKLFGDAGVEYSQSYTGDSWSVGEYDTRSLGSITMTIPASGYVVVTHTGWAYLYNETRVMGVGVGSNITTILNDVWLGKREGAGVDNWYVPYSVTGVFEVTAGSRIFYALGRGTSSFATGTAYLQKETLIGIFIPKHY